jgi:hypothetical protein
LGYTLGYLGLPWATLGYLGLEHTLLPLHYGDLLENIGQNPSIYIVYIFFKFFHEHKHTPIEPIALFHFDIKFI